MTIIKRRKNSKFDRDAEKRENLNTVGGIVNQYSRYGQKYGGFSENYKYNYHMIQKSHYCVYIFKN